MSEFLIYQTEDGTTQLSVVLDDETIWLNQRQLTELFGKAKGTISEHIKNIFAEGELTPEATVRLFRTVQIEGERRVERDVEHYNLDMVLALGYRVRSTTGVRFRQWASAQLKELIVKGFVLDDERLKKPSIGRDYFDELAQRLQDIRVSERRFYQKITDIYATSVDYDPKAELTQTFFASVQNKMHYAIHGHTAAELVMARANSSLPQMGLTTIEGARVRKSDVGTAKNYLTSDELGALNNLAEQYLIFAEGQAMRRVAMNMQDWVIKLEGFLSLNDREILKGAGKVTAALAKQHAEEEFAKFRVIDDAQFESDFDQMLKRIPQKKKQ